jgi:hypothetical protein
MKLYVQIIKVLKLLFCKIKNQKLNIKNSYLKEVPFIKSEPDGEIILHHPKLMGGGIRVISGGTEIPLFKYKTVYEK